MSNSKSKPHRRGHNLHVLLLICISFLLPIGWLSHRLAQEENVQIAFAESQQHGAMHGAALYDFLHALLQQRDLLTPDGDTTPSTNRDSARQAMRAKLDRIVADVDALDQRNGEIWQSSDEWHLIRTNWRELLARLDALDTAASHAQHGAIAQALISHIETISEHSKLALDPRLDIHNISQVMTFSVPGLTLDLADLRYQGMRMAAESETAMQDRLLIGSRANQAEQKLTVMRRSMAAVFASRPDLKRELGSQFDTTATGIGAALHSVEVNFEYGRSTRFSPSEWHAWMTLAANDLSNLSNVIAVKRNELIAARLATLKKGQSTTQTLTAVLVLLALAVATLLGARLLASIRTREWVLRSRSQAQAERQRAEQASAAKSDFLAAMSHEIRTPLNAMVGFSDLLAGSALTPEQSAWAQQVVDNAASLARLIDDILDMSKIEAGKLSIENIAASPRAIVEQCANTYRVLAQKKGLGFELELNALPEVVLLDPVRLRQILLNFLSNALKFTYSGQIKLSASAGKRRLRFEVRDTGIGIDEKRRAHLFDTAYQTDAATTREFGGTGLGLQICAKLTVLMRGHIGVESALGVGSLLWLELPELLVDADSQPASMREGEQRGEAGAHRQALITRFNPPLEMLVADDVESNRLLVSSIASSLGCHVRTANDGVEAVREASARSFELILLDLHMPKLNGIEAARQIRASGPNRETAILALTASAYASDAARCTAAGMNDHVAKPVRATALRDTIAKWGAIARGHAQPHADSAAPLSASAAATPDRAASPPTPAAVATVTETPNGTAPWIDEALFAEQTEGLQADTIMALLISLRERMDAVDAAIRAGVMPESRAELQWTVHQLVSSSGMLGAMPLSDAAARLDSALAEQRPLEEVRQLAQELLSVLGNTGLALANRPTAA